MNKRMWIALCLFPLMLWADSDSLFQALTQHPHRLPGSPEFAASLTAVADTLEAAGYEPHIQTFPAIGREIVRCDLKVNGKVLKDVHPVDNGVGTWVMDQPRTLRVVDGGNGSYTDLKGKEINRDTLVILDLNDPGLEVNPSLMSGAYAVCLIGDHPASIWQLQKLNFMGPGTLPILFVPPAAAASAGFMEGAEVELQVQTRLVDVEGQNLWVHLPASNPETFNFSNPETLILSAPLDSYGLVPTYSPDERGAANAVLLTDVAAELYKQAEAGMLKRDVVMVWWGSRNHGQVAARYFYYSHYQSGKIGLPTESLEARKQGFVNERADLEGPLASMKSEDLFAEKGDDAIRLRPRVKDKMTGIVNALNSHIRIIRVEKESLKQSLNQDGDSEVIQARMEALQIEIDKASARKEVWNLLRKSQNDGGLPEREDIRQAYAELIAELTGEFQLYRQYLDEMLAHIETWDALMQVFVNRKVVAHLDFDFSNDQQEWIFGVIGDPDITATLEITIGNYQKFLSRLAAFNESEPMQTASGAKPFAPALRPFYKPSSLTQPWVRSVPSTIGLMTGVTGFQLMNAGPGDLNLDGLPLRTGTRLSGLREPLETILIALASLEDFSIKGPLSDITPDSQMTYTYEGNGSFNGRRFEDRSEGSQDIEGPSNNAVVLIRPGARGGAPMMPGQFSWAVSRINANGYTWVPLMVKSSMRHNSTRLMAFGYTPDGKLERVANKTESQGHRSGRVPLFYSYGGHLLSSGITGSMLEKTWGGGQVGVLDAASDSKFRSSNSLEVPQMQHFYTDKNSRLKYVGDQGELLLGSTPEHPKGIGISMDPEELLHLNVIEQQADDNWLLNEKRLKALRERNIVNDTLESLHADAEEFLLEAKDAKGEMDHAKSDALYTLSALMSYRVHDPLKASTQDLVHAVVFLLLLNIPFAFAMERMIFGFPSIYKQVGGFVGFFIATFIILYFTHPAFALASAPIVIFLAFVIILLSGITVCIVMGKIKQEIRAIQGMASTAHGVGNDSNTALAAVLIGISGMRNRPLKTFLTALTVVLLTFTILAFASFSSELGVVKTYLGQGTGPERIELHRYSFLGIPQNFIDAVQQHYGEDFDVALRGGIYPNPTQGYDQRSTSLKSELLVQNLKNEKVQVFEGFYGLVGEEVENDPRLSAMLKDFNVATESGYPRIYLTKLSMDRLEALPGEVVNVNGTYYEVSEPFESKVLRNLSTLEGYRMVLPDFKEIVSNINEGAKLNSDGETLEQVDVSQLEWMAPEEMMITDLKVLQAHAQNISEANMLVLYPKSEEVDVEEAAGMLAKVFAGAVHARGSEGVNRYFFTRAVAGSGLNDVIIPLLLGGLIIFSSLMGSIVDREKEIFTYSALGLSPPDVGMLFFAESAVYSVVGGMGGYLVSQVVAKIATALSEAGLIQVPTMNFSSLSSVLTILVVMAVVMLSTIAPAIKAGRSANPGVNRKWKMPMPEADRLSFVFPFTVSEADFQGILSFVYEHFENHSDATLGSFAARDVRLFSEPDPESGKPRQGIEANLSLAPFDLGIFQSFRMFSKEFELPGIEEVVVEIERIGGMPGSWIRGNRKLAEDLRAQFLIWRSLPIDTVELYRSQTKERMAASAQQMGESSHV